MSAVIIRMRAQKKALWWASVMITIHLGMNPRKGGSPPRDRKESMQVSFTIGELDVIRKV